jgi:ribonuclease P protein component
VPLAVACPPTGREGSAAEEATEREAHISAEHPSPGTQARFSCSHADPGGASGRSISSPAWPQPAVGLIGRIRDRATFEALRRKGRRARCDGVSVVYLAASTGQARVAYGVGRKMGSAVVRNRVRRRLRAVMRQLDGERGGLPPGAYLVGVAPSVVRQSYGDLYRNVVQACAMAVAEGSVGGSDE